MPYPREAPPTPPPPDAPPSAPAPVPDPAAVPDFESLVGLGVAAVAGFHTKHPGHYERLHRDYMSRAGVGRARPFGR